MGMRIVEGVERIYNLFEDIRDSFVDTFDELGCVLEQKNCQLAAPIVEADGLDDVV